LRNLSYYTAALFTSAGYLIAVTAAATVLAVVLGIVKRRTGCGRLYIAWALSALAVIFWLAARDERYLFFVIAPAAVLLCATLERIGQALAGPKRAWLVPVAIAVVLAGVNLAEPAPFLRGPTEAARLVASGGPSRILYCGRTNGSFIFGVRTLDPQLRDTVIRGDRLPSTIFTPPGFENFAHRYGIQFVVLERSSIRRAWDALFDSPSPSMDLVREVPLSSSDLLANGRLRIFRFTNPSAAPEPFKLRIRRIHEDLEVN
jgi:hypothetical protein